MFSAAKFVKTLSRRFRPSLRLSTRLPARFLSVGHKAVVPGQPAEAPKTGTITVKVNGVPIAVPDGSSVLDACKAAREQVPTLCYHPMLESVGLCRLCLVEQVVHPQGQTFPNPPNKLIAACATDAYDGMEILTETNNTVAGVKNNLKLLRCRHPNKCMTCEVNGKCQFQDLVYRYQVEDILPMFEPREHDAIKAQDFSSHALNRDMNKCVVCTRCVRACADVQGMNVYGMTERGFDEHVTTIQGIPLKDTQCISCGQCTAVCPVGALTEKPHVHEVQRLLHGKHLAGKILVASTAPAVRVAIGEEFFMEPGSISTGKMVAALRKAGFDYVFDTNFTADVTIMEEAAEFLRRLQNGGPFPMFTSCCPGWINLCEKMYPGLEPHLSTCKSPQGMMGALIKRYFAARIGADPRNIVHVSIMPCVAKKDEIARPQLVYEYTKDGIQYSMPETDYVLTTRELGHLLKNEDVHFPSLVPSEYDMLLGESTGAAALFGVTGGVMEAALRTAVETATGKELASVDFKAVRGLESTTGGIREAKLDVGGTELRVAVAHGTKNVRQLVDGVLGKDGHYSNMHLIEVMACPGGCIGGGGQSKSLDKNILEKRRASIYEIDAQKAVRRSHNNVMVKNLYESYLGKPLGEKAHHILHTHYTDRTGEVRVSTPEPHGPIPTEPRKGAV